MLNSFQFSAAKSKAEAKLLQAAVFDSDNSVKPYSKFKKDADQITNITQETWLRVERETCVRQAVQSEAFRNMIDDSDLYPYWVYKGVMDDREREDHVDMEGLVFRINDPAGDACFPPNDFNCRCDGESCDGDEVKDKGYRVQTHEEAKQWLQDNVDDQFRYNPADQGMMPNTGSYFEVMGSANEGNGSIFGMDKIDSDDQLEGLSSVFIAATGLHNLIETTDEWRKNYHTNKSGEIIFQNKKLLSNVLFTNNSLHHVQKHSRGFENIPATIMQPDEVWHSWSNSQKQKDVIRNYIKYGRICYVVQTFNGVISDAFSIPKSSVNKFRKGVIHE